MSPDKKKNSAVTNYISILFGAAFLLMMMTYFMEQREAAEILQGLRTSVSGMQSVEEMYQENAQLKDQLKELELELNESHETVEDLEQDLAETQHSLEDSKLSLEAMDWFWQVKSAYMQEDWELSWELMGEMEHLSTHLPTVSQTANGSFSPAHTYLNMKRELERLQEED